MNEFYKFIVAKAEEEPVSAELLIFDVIGNWDDMGEVSAKRFHGDLTKLPKSVKRLDIHINSPGGSVSEAMAIYSRLADHRSDKHIYIDGLAASAASLIAMVGHKIYIRANANVMIHLPMALAMGNADDMRTVIAALESHTESMINVYARRTKLERDELRSLMAAETWFHPEAAVEKGFADEVRGVIKAAASIGDRQVMFNGRTFDLSRFHNVPAFSGEQSKPTMKTKPKAEQTPAGDPPPQPPEPEHTETPPQPAPEPAPAPAGDPPKPHTVEGDRTPAAAETDYDKGVQAERQRVLALSKMDRPGTHEVITKAIAEGKQPADITVELFEAMEKAGRQDARRSDASSLSRIPPSDGADEGNGFGELVKAKVEERKKQMRPRANFSRN